MFNNHFVKVEPNLRKFISLYNRGYECCMSSDNLGSLYLTLSCSSETYQVIKTSQNKKKRYGMILGERL